MDDDMKSTIYEMHGSVQRLEEKTDNLIDRQARLDKEINDLEQTIDNVSDQAESNQRKLYGMFLLASTIGTAGVMVSTLAPTFFS